MSESRKNNFNVDGAHANEEEHATSYKPIPESDTEFRPPSKASLSKSKEKVSSDGAEEKLLNKEDEAKITTRVDMAEAKYIVGDHRNGDAKIELDANKRQFSGLTKEELLKYADDPFWVRLRWFMFILFWALWLAMLAGAIAIIVRAPKCYPPAAKTWYEVGPLADRSSEAAVDYSELETELPLLERAKVQGIFINPCTETYEVLETTNCIDDFKKFLVKAKEKSIKLIVDLTANYVSNTHKWFTSSENSTAEYSDYFVWGASKEFVPDGTRPQVPNNWVSRNGGPAWSYSERRQQYYLHQYHAHQPDLNFHNQLVQAHFDNVLHKWMAAGASGVRLLKARQLIVNKELPNEQLDRSNPAALSDYASLKHKETTDRPELDGLLQHWSALVAAEGEDNVFTIHEDGILMPEWYVLRNSSALRPSSAAPIELTSTTDLHKLADQLNKIAENWTAVQLTADSAGNTEVVSLSMLLPITPLLMPGQLQEDSNLTQSGSFGHLSQMRDDATVKYGKYRVLALPNDENARFLAVERWKEGHTGFVAVYNFADVSGNVNLTALPTVPAVLAVHHVSAAVSDATNYTSNSQVFADAVSVPAYSAVVLSYVPKTAAEI